MCGRDLLYRSPYRTLLRMFLYTVFIAVHTNPRVPHEVEGLLGA